MLDFAQGLLRNVQDRLGTTLQVVADLAESLGLPPVVTELLQRGGRERAASFDPSAEPVWPRNGSNDRPARGEPAVLARPTPMPTVEPGDPKVAGPHESAKHPGSNGNGPASASGSSARASRKRPVAGDRNKSSRVRMLEAHDAIHGSTYLARIVWTLGVAQLEGLGPLRPADMARMIMSRSPVSLEPPNVARYIRRSHPSCIAVDRAEGGSSFYKLNAQGKRLFEATFCGGN